MAGRGIALVVALAALSARGADDLHGDPLPEGARARLGTIRLRSVGGGGAPSALTPDGKHLVASSFGGETVFVDPTTGKPARAVKVAGAYMVHGFSRDGKRGVSAGADATLVWDAATGKVLAAVKRAVPSGETAVSLSADGKRLALGGIRRDKDRARAVVWDVDADRQLVAVEPVQNDTVLVALSPDGRRLATWGFHYDAAAKQPPAPEADPARQVQFWDVGTGKETAKVHVPGGYHPTAVTFAPDGTLLAAAAGNGTIHVYDPATGARKLVLLGRARQGRRLAFSPDGKTLAAAGDDGSVQRWSVADGKPLGTTEPPVAAPYGLRAIAFADDTRVVVWATKGIASFVWEAPAGKLLGPAGGHTTTVQSLAFVAGGKEILTAAADGSVLRWDAATGKELGPVALKPPVATGLAPAGDVTLAPDGARALARESGVAGLALYDLPAGTQAFVIPGADDRGTFSADGTKVLQVLGGGDPKKDPARVTVWDVAGARRLGMVELAGATYPSAALTPDGKTLVTAGSVQDVGARAATFRVTGWDLATGKKLGEFNDEGGFGGGFVAAAGDNKSAVVVTPQRAALLLDLTTGKKVRDLAFDRAANSTAAPAVSPDGKTAAFLLGVYGQKPAGKVLLVDLETGKLKKTLDGLPANPSAALFAPDGKTLLTGFQDGSTLVWDLAK